MVLAAFLIWWGWRAVRIWHARNAEPFACAAVIASAVILVHSLVDYPLRTAGLSCVFAMCCVAIARYRQFAPPRPTQPRSRPDHS